MIVSDKKRIIETIDNENLDGVIGYCDTVGAYILYRRLDGLPVIKEYPVNENEKWDEIWEVDIQERKTGNTIECIYSGNDHDKACEIATKWNLDHGYTDDDLDDCFDWLCHSDCNPKERYYANLWLADNIVLGVGKVD